MSVPSSQTSFLVVDGIINTQGSTKINLSRTTLLSEKGTRFENDAVVEIQGDDNSRYPLSYRDSGRYVSGVLELNQDAKYRISIATTDNRKYLSSFVRPVKTPEIDSITWIRYKEGIEIYANAHDQLNDTRYYKFEYDETWEFRSFVQTNLVTIVKRNPPSVGDIEVGLVDPAGMTFDSSRYFCWQSNVSKNVIIANTLRLNNSRLYAPIVYYPNGAWQFSVLYSMNLKQTGLSKEGYEFFRKMQKNTESLGSIFDGLPSEIKGNIRCISDTAEDVIGFIDAARTTAKRVFIKNSDLIGWKSLDTCRLYGLPQTPPNLFQKLWIEKNIPVGLNLIGEIYRADAFCVDCRLRGTNTRPSFWPK